MNDITVNSQDIIKLLEKLNVHKGLGSDNIPNVFLRNCSRTIWKPLQILFQHSLTSGIFPSTFKETIIFQFLKRATPKMFPTID